MKKYAYLCLPASAGAAVALSGLLVFLTATHPFPPPDRIREVGRSAVEDSLALSLGLRRLAADVWFIRLMQYYGTPPEPGEGWIWGKGYAHSELESNFGGGAYPDFLSMARHILALDPYFTNAALYAAASLAFNLSRPTEAVSLLNGALVDRPREWKYVTLLAAIGYSKAKDPAKVAGIITPLIREPDCPVMLRQLAAFLNKKAGNYRAAYFIYETILETTKDQFYLDNARKELAKLEETRGIGIKAGRRR